MVGGCPVHGFVIETTHDCRDDSWEAVLGVSGARLAAHGLIYNGYRNSPQGSALLRVVPSLRVTMDLSLARPPRVGAVPLARAAVFGLREHAMDLERAGGQGVVVELPPPAAYALLGGLPLWELSGSVVDLTAVLGGRAEQVVTRLAAARGWRARFAVLDEVLTAWAGPSAAPQVEWAWRRLCRAGGRVPVEQLAGEVGWTRRHLRNRFRDQIGLAPKAAARVIRFQYALRQLRRGRRSVAEVALASGYSDQSHLHREFRALADATPGELAP
ncbi:helix-turn-helix transcriptional regulator [Nonomuraea typhae]|uniref:Helix-turn-helix transcriptional regulator n=1 Tax=Nonomuraea typhae TaxID=2603600 RepID=A0ABW7YRT4_9ACTN